MPGPGAGCNIAVMVDAVRPARKKLFEPVRDMLLEMIRNGDVGVGGSLPSERELMERLGVGRPAIREAMQSLAAAGLIEIRHGGRARVAEPSVGRMVEQVGETMKHILMNSPASLEHLKEARALFEREMARIAAGSRTPGDVLRLEGIIAAMARSIDDPEAFREQDGRFHREIAAMGGNPIYPALIGALFGWLTDFHADLVAVPGLERLTLQEHRGILAAIAAGDAEAAGAAMADHLLRANAQYRQSNLAKGSRPAG